MEICRFELIEHYDKYLHSYLEDETASKYIQKVYDYLEMMEHRKVLMLQASENKLPWMLVAVGAFINSGNNWRHFELNDDCTKIRCFR